MLDDLDDIVIQEYATREASMEGVVLIKAAIKSINGYINYIARFAKASWKYIVKEYRIKNHQSKIKNQQLPIKNHYATSSIPWGAP